MKFLRRYDALPNRNVGAGLPWTVIFINFGNRSYFNFAIPCAVYRPFRFAIFIDYNSFDLKNHRPNVVGGRLMKSRLFEPRIRPHDAVLTAHRPLPFAADREQNNYMARK